VRIVIAADHAGFHLKEDLKKKLLEAGHEVVDIGTHSSESTDYPDFAYPAARMVAGGQAEQSILICGTGAGMAITANRLAGVRAVVCFSVEMARLARTHNNANALCLASRLTDEDMAWQIVQVFLNTAFEGGRHLRRIEKIDRDISAD
jgi:ribose 5-phosphate isomerase B